MAIEHWKTISVAPEYEVSDLGRVRHKPHINWRGRFVKERLLKPVGKPYLGVTLFLSGGLVLNIQVSHLVLNVFARSRLPNEQARHLNDIQSDNRLSNLAWGLAKENRADAIKNNKHSHKLYYSQVLIIRWLWWGVWEGKPPRGKLTELANSFRVTKTHIKWIVEGMTHKDEESWKQAELNSNIIGTPWWERPDSPPISKEGVEFTESMKRRRQSGYRGTFSD